MVSMDSDGTLPMDAFPEEAPMVECVLYMQIISGFIFGISK